MSLVSEQSVVIINHLRNELLEALSTDYLINEIEYDGKRYLFRPPLNDHDKEEQDAQRYELIHNLLLDAYTKQIDKGFNCIPVCSNPFILIDQILDNRPSREQVQSPIDPRSYEEIRIEAAKQIGLNYDSYQVKMQDPELEMDENGYPL